ncbi:MAG: FAD-dependent oxidoreductase [Chloroflexi bacterium]|nr:FAD-dependent oxidoreductase [Chloroflexota bacterium]MDA1271507.1 FAD-dependent oxidoreductase [Chloroflexota bacterium]
MTSNSRDVVIIGGGIVACLSAYLLGRRGFKVTILEKDSVGSHASGFAFGGLDPLTGVGMPEPLLEFSLWCYGRHRSLARELQEQTGVDVGFELRDRLHLAFEDGEAAAIKNNIEWMKAVGGFHVEWVDNAQARRLEPQVSPECLGALYEQSPGALEPYRFVLAAMRAAERHGAEVIQRQATGLITEGGRCTGVQLENGRVDAGVVILAMGPWTGQAGAWCGVDIPVTPLKGQILRLRSGKQPLNLAVNYSHSYVATKPDGLIWAGTTEEESGFEETVTIAARDSIMGDLLKMIPGMYEAELVQQTACLRPLSGDGLPIVDKVTGWDNLYVATGAGRKGILWSTGMAHIVFDLVSDGKTDVSGAEHLLLDRF